MSSNSTASKETLAENQSTNSKDAVNETLSGKQRRRGKPLLSNMSNKVLTRLK
jgi:hypothetical protein